MHLLSQMILGADNNGFLPLGSSLFVTSHCLQGPKSQISSCLSAEVPYWSVQMGSLGFCKEKKFARLRSESHLRAVIMKRKGILLNQVIRRFLVTGKTVISIAVAKSANHNSTFFISCLWLNACLIFSLLLFWPPILPTVNHLWKLKLRTLTLPKTKEFPTSKNRQQQQQTATTTNKRKQKPNNNKKTTSIVFRLIVRSDKCLQWLKGSSKTVWLTMTEVWGQVFTSCVGTHWMGSAITQNPLNSQMHKNSKDVCETKTQTVDQSILSPKWVGQCKKWFTWYGTKIQIQIHTQKSPLLQQYFCAVLFIEWIITSYNGLGWKEQLRPSNSNPLL